MQYSTSRIEFTVYSWLIMLGYYWLVTTCIYGRSAAMLAELAILFYCASCLDLLSLFLQSNLQGRSLS